ncbi:uncharacterized protein LOC116417194 isoform X2 [Nasonia vitripennis]|uniref:Uncharacterized protein n=1 Tax=Nasonia vitripennis TaxID=7425 RepID=A0A7M7QX86_NASVI|nr:uncharacterized protein LOC116417194 isoform X2 [Nasonia vitripennis]
MSTDKIFYACLRYVDDKWKYYYAPVSSIFDKRHDKMHIRPKNLDDFDPKHRYQVLWNFENTSLDESNFISNEFYETFIICLAETKKDAQIKGETKTKRLIMPKKLSSTDSSESVCDDEDDKVHKSQCTKKFKQQILINSRTTINQENEEAFMSSSNTINGKLNLEPKVLINRIQKENRSCYASKKDLFKKKKD